MPDISSVCVFSCVTVFVRIRNECIFLVATKIKRMKNDVVLFKNRFFRRKMELNVTCFGIIIGKKSVCRLHMHNARPYVLMVLKSGRTAGNQCSLLCAYANFNLEKIPNVNQKQHIFGNAYAQ